MNSDYLQVDPFVAPDGSYLLFGSRRPGGLGLSDLYVSFRRSDGGWSHPHIVGKEMNELIFPFRMSVTPDGKYFFFLRDRPTPISKVESLHSPSAEWWGDTDVYWVDTRFINELERKFRNKQCAAEAVRDQYAENGLEPALEKMRELVSDDAYYFELSELLVLCGSMIESGELVDALGGQQAFNIPSRSMQSPSLALEPSKPILAGTGLSDIYLMFPCLGRSEN